jgi:hypothetical protein
MIAQRPSRARLAQARRAPSIAPAAPVRDNGRAPCATRGGSMAAQTTPVFDSHAAFGAALRWGFEQAIARGARRIVCVDPDFTDWPLGDATLLARLVPWLRQPQRRLVLLAARFDELPRHHPRFVGWRRDWVHAVSAWQAPDELQRALPTLLLVDDALAVRVIDRSRWRGRTLHDARECRPYHDEIDAVLQRSAPGLPVTELGL